MSTDKTPETKPVVDNAATRLAKANELIEQLCNTLMPVAQGTIDGADGLPTQKRLGVEAVFNQILGWRGQF